MTERLNFHALKKEMTTNSSILAWRIPGTEEPSGLLSMGSHRVGHEWSDLAAAAAAADCSPPSFSAHGILHGKKTGVGCHVLSQEIFLTQGLNPGLLLLLHYRPFLYHWATRDALWNRTANLKSSPQSKDSMDKSNTNWPHFENTLEALCFLKNELVF